MQTSLHGIAESAKRFKAKRFRSLYSYLNHLTFERAYFALNKKAAAGSDKVSWADYGRNLKDNLLDLEERLKQKRYRAKFLRRVLIPKGKDKYRPLSIPAIEDKIVQYAVREILEVLFEPLFLDCSYAYRPNRCARQAAETLREELRYKCQWVVEADIRSYFDTIDHEWLVKMLKTRINDRALIRLIQKWLRAGIVYPDGAVEHPEKGTAQGSIISPVLSNIYLHFVLDQWFGKKVTSQCTGKAILIRYADDFVAAFRYHKDAANFMRMLKMRFTHFGLEVAKEKTRKLRFNRYRKEDSETFVFLGFEFCWIVSRRGKDIIRLRISRKKLREIVSEFKQWCKECRNKRLKWIMVHVKSKLRGLRNYFGVPGNSANLREILYLFKRLLYKWLNRRSERKSYNWKTFRQMLQFYNVEGSKKLVNQGIQLSFLQHLA
jgi:group II intron reverse transcriptase/maturase